MKPRDPEFSVAGEPVEAEPLFSAEQRAELRRELGPSAVNRTRVRDALWSSAATGALSPTAQRVDTLLQAKAASVVGAKAATAATVHSLTAKLVIASVLLAGGATAVVLRAPSVQERPAAIAPAAARESRALTQPVASAAESLRAAPLEAAIQPAPTQPVAPAAERVGAAPLEAAIQPALTQPVAPSAERVRAASPEPAIQLALTTASDPPKRSPESARRHQKLSAAVSAARATRSPLRAASASSGAAAVAQTDNSKDPAQAAHPLPSVAAPVPAPLVDSDPASRTKAAQPVAAAQATPPAHALAAEITLAPAAQPVAVTQTIPPTHALAAEIALVRAASEALQRNDPQTALAQLQRHAAEFSRGALRVEVEALRAIALCTTHSDQAAAVSGRFLRAHAGAPLAERVRRACLEL